MTEISLHEKLIGLGVDKLASLLIEHSYQDKALTGKINLALLKTDPDKLIKHIKSRLSGIMRRKPSFNRYYSAELASELTEIINSVTEDVLPHDAKKAIKIMEDLLNKAEKIHELADDSYGNIGDFFRDLSHRIGMSWAAIEDRNEDDLAKKVFESMLSNDYGEKDNLITDMAEALGITGLNKLRAIFKLRRKEYETGYSKIEGPLKQIADAKNDPDEYIALLSESDEVHTYEVCEIAKRLISHDREDEAIKWLIKKPNDISSSGSLISCDLKKINPHGHYEQERYKLLLCAYKKRNYTTELENLSWKLFELTLSKQYYDIAVENKDEDEKDRFKNSAISLILEKPGNKLSTCLIFLREINEFKLISKLIIDNHEQIHKDSYYFYRPLSSKLHDESFDLAACILRRKLIEGVLEKGLSKYYNYAVSDLSCAMKYADKINTWQSFMSHEEYMLFLKQHHGRKTAFWNKVKHEMLVN